MEDDESQRINEKDIPNSKIIEIDSIYSVSGSICRIIDSKGTGTGFFMKLEKSKKPFYCLLTCEHVINEEMINSKTEIEVYYENQNSKIEITLNKDERFIRSYKYINIDATVIEILPKDNINAKLFLLPNLDYISGYDKFEGQEIFLPQYPGNKNLSFSKGKIKNINIYTNEFSHLASTHQGSSGSPIFLSGSSLVLGIHKQAKINKEENYGNFLGPVFNSLKNNYLFYNEETIQIEFNGINGCGKIINKDASKYYIGELNYTNNNYELNGKGIMYSTDGKKILNIF